MPEAGTFSITLLPPSDGGFQSVAVAQHSQQCVDNTNLSTADGNGQQQFYCEGGDQQLWNFRPVSGRGEHVHHRQPTEWEMPGRHGVSTADGAPVTQWTCHTGLNQQFTLRKVTYPGNDSHDYQLVARHSGKCADVSTISTAPRAPIHQWTCDPAGQGGTQPELAALGKITRAAGSASVQTYLDYALPGIWVLAIGFGASQTGVAIADDPCHRHDRPVPRTGCGPG